MALIIRTERFAMDMPRTHEPACPDSSALADRIQYVWLISDFSPKSTDLRIVMNLTFSRFSEVNRNRSHRGPEFIRSCPASQHELKLDFNS